MKTQSKFAALSLMAAVALFLLSPTLATPAAAQGIGSLGGATEVGNGIGTGIGGLSGTRRPGPAISYNVDRQFPSSALEASADGFTGYEYAYRTVGVNGRTGQLDTFCGILSNCPGRTH